MSSNDSLSYADKVEIMRHFQEHGRKATLKAYGKQDASKLAASSELNIYLPKKGDITDMDWELYDRVHDKLRFQLAELKDKHPRKDYYDSRDMFCDRGTWIANKVLDVFTQLMIRQNGNTPYPPVALVLARINNERLQQLEFHKYPLVFLYLGEISMDEFIVMISMEAFLPHVEKLRMPNKNVTHEFVFHQSLARFYIDQEHDFTLSLLKRHNLDHLPKDFRILLNRPFSGTCLHWAFNISREINQYYTGPCNQDFLPPNKSIHEVDAYLRVLLEEQLGWSRDGIITVLHSDIKGTMNSIQLSLEWLLARFCTQFLCKRTAWEAFQQYSVRYARTVDRKGKSKAIPPQDPNDGIDRTFATLARKYGKWMSEYFEVSPEDLMRWIVFEKLENIRKERKALGSIPSLVIDTIGIHMQVLSYATVNASARVGIKERFFRNLASAFFGYPIHETNTNRYKSTSDARRRMREFLLAAGVEYDNPEKMGIFIWRFQREQVLQLTLHRQYLLLPNRLVKQEPWMSVDQFVDAIIGFVEGSDRNQGPWAIEEIFLLVMYRRLFVDMRGTAQLLGEQLGRTQYSVEKKIIELFAQGRAPDVDAIEEEYGDTQ